MATDRLDVHLILHLLESTAANNLLPTIKTVIKCPYSLKLLSESYLRLGQRFQRKATTIFPCGLFVAHFVHNTESAALQQTLIGKAISLGGRGQWEMWQESAIDGGHRPIGFRVDCQ